MKSTVIFTGGHHNSSLVIAKALKKDNFNVIWFGHKYNSRRDKALSVEYQEVMAAKIPFYYLRTGKFYKNLNPFEHLRIIFGIFQSIFYLLKLKPALVVSFGGYLAVPVIVGAWILGIPSITHEQTVVAGWANKAIAPLVKKILITHQSSAKNFPSHKTEYVGLPLEAELLQNLSTKKKFTPPLLFITCGKQGSHLINQTVFPLIPELVKKFTVVHQIGSNTLTKDSEKARRLRDSLGELKTHYITAPYFYAKDYVNYLASARVVISRAGAHTTYKLALLKKRSILIPIPWVSHNEQVGNAKLTQKNTPTVILTETDLTPQKLSQAIDQVLELKPNQYQSTLPANATETTVAIIKEYL